MNKAIKVDALIKAWLQFIALEELSQAQIPGDEAKLSGVKLVSDRVLIEKHIFSEIQQSVTEEKRARKQETPWVLSFPQMFTVYKGKSQLCPLFNLDITSILAGEYSTKGWNIDRLELIDPKENLEKFLGLEEAKSEQLLTKEGLRRFLSTTFNLKEFDSFEYWMKRVRLPSKYKILPQPYLFKLKESGFYGNLKRDLNDIKDSSRSYWFKKEHSAYEYLFGEPKDPKDEVIYVGAFPTDPPTHSQLKALKHAQSQPLTAVQGPPGSGKTTLILHLIAQQVVTRALSLIETGTDINNLTIVTSTVNKAVENVIEKLDQQLGNVNFYIKGGNLENINKSAKEQLKMAIVYLKEFSFDENHQSYLSQEIKQLKDELVAQQKHYLELRRQRDEDEALRSQLRETLHTHLDELIATRTEIAGQATELTDYELFPIEAYKKIHSRLNIAQALLPDKVLSWLARLWRWLARRIEKFILDAMKLACQSEIQKTRSTPFPVKFPATRSALVAQRKLIQIQLNIYEIRRELTPLERKLETRLEDFASFHEQYHEQHKKLFRLSREFLNQEALRCKDRLEPTLKLYFNLLSEDWNAKQKIAEEMAENLDEHLKALSLMFPVITCGLLSVRNMLPWVKECVDRTIVDEAGMILLQETFPLLVRSRKAIVVGDPLQIQPIINQSPQTLQQYHQKAFTDKRLTESDIYCYSPDKIDRATTYHRAAGASEENNYKGHGIPLIEHFRCQRSIIEYCKNIAGYELDIKTTPKPPRLESNLIAYHVEGNIEENVNKEEVTAIGELIQHLLNQGYLLSDIGVISAFRDQADALRDYLPKQFPQQIRRDDDIGTIHTFQGSQRKVIILSTKVCRPQDRDKVNWINRRPNLLNVAVSRAEELFILVGNLYRLEKAEGYTSQLVKHIREHGIIFEYKSEEEIPKQTAGSALVQDCQHLDVLKTAIDEAEHELTIVTPWIRGSEPKRFMRDITSALERGVKVTVIYGFKGDEENDNNDAKTEQDLISLLSQYQGSSLITLGQEKYVESSGTNERILVCDSKFAVVGSWNWLSHLYRDYCNKHTGNSKAQIRKETSIKLSDLLSISEIKERIAQHFKSD